MPACMSSTPASPGAHEAARAVRAERARFPVEPHARRSLRSASVLRAHVGHQSSTRSGSAAACGIIDVADPLSPREIGHFIRSPWAADPRRRPTTWRSTTAASSISSTAGSVSTCSNSRRDASPPLLIRAACCRQSRNPDALNGLGNVLPAKSERRIMTVWRLIICRTSNKDAASSGGIHAGQLHAGPSRPSSRSEQSGTEHALRSGHTSPGAGGATRRHRGLERSPALGRSLRIQCRGQSGATRGEVIYYYQMLDLP